MSIPSRVAVYARISSDPDGQSAGVERQLTDCRKLAAELGWTIAEEYIDNDMSAFSGKRRPRWEQMLADFAAGERDGLLAYHQDRLTRRPIEFERLLEILDQNKVRMVRFTASGEAVDLADGDGLSLLRMKSVFAAQESAAKSRRLRRKHEDIAARGMPNGGSMRPFGWEEDRMTIRETEAAVLRDLVDRHITGESFRSLAVWLNEQGIPTTTGNQWKGTTLRNTMLSARHAGLREHKGVVVGPAAWPPIFSPAKRDQLLAAVESRKATGRRAPRKYLLSGLLRCGKCDGKLFSSARKTGRRYVCLSGPDHGGCGGIAVTAEPVEDLITDAVLYRLDGPAVADNLADKAAGDERMTALIEELTSDRTQLEELARAYGEKLFTLKEWTTARAPIESRIRSAERELHQLTNTDAITGLVGNGEALCNQWSGLILDRQHAIIRAVLDHAVIAPGSPKATKLDPERVQPVWQF